VWAWSLMRWAGLYQGGLALARDGGGPGTFRLVSANVNNGLGRGLLGRIRDLQNVANLPGEFGFGTFCSSQLRSVGNQETRNEFGAECRLENRSDRGLTAVSRRPATRRAPFQSAVDVRRYPATAPRHSAPTERGRRAEAHPKSESILSWSQRALTDAGRL
jgi:hypothetical protein